MVSRNKQKGFTLIEILVVISIISLLSSVVLVSFKSAREKAKLVKAKADARQIVDAMALLGADTGKWPGGCPAWTWSNPEILLDNSVESGLTVPPQPGIPARWWTSGYTDHPCEWTTDDLNKWQGPYAQIPKDPWGHSYVLDYDYCDESRNGVVAVLSLGPDGSEEYKTNCGLGNGFAPYNPPGAPPGDDIVVYPAADPIPYCSGGVCY